MGSVSNVSHIVVYLLVRCACIWA